MMQLHTVVPLCLHDPNTDGPMHYRHNSRATTNWEAVSLVMNRSVTECIHKWNNMQDSIKKKGNYTADEDALILQRVAEWGNKGNGLWIRLEKELGRPAKHVAQRFKFVLSKRL